MCCRSLPRALAVVPPVSPAPQEQVRAREPWSQPQAPALTLRRAFSWRQRLAHSSPCSAAELMSTLRRAFSWRQRLAHSSPCSAAELMSTHCSSLQERSMSLLPSPWTQAMVTPCSEMPRAPELLQMSKTCSTGQNLLHSQLGRAACLSLVLARARPQFPLLPVSVVAAPET